VCSHSLQVGLESFAASCHRQRVAKLDVSRVLVGSRALFAVGGDFFGQLETLRIVGQPIGVTLADDDESFDFLALRLVRHADDGAQRDGRVRLEHLFYLAGIDVEPAPDDHVLFAVYDEKVAVLVH